VKEAQVHELLYQALETELGGVQVYTKAIECAVNPELREEWNKYLDETKTHVEIMTKVFEDLGLDPEKETPGRQVVRFKGQSLVKSMDMALTSGPEGAAQLVAAEAVVDAETKDHANWELMGKVAEKATGRLASVLGEAYEQVEEQEDMHLYHTMGWCRELWIESLGMPAALPPPEEERKVTTAIGADRARQARDEYV
jgi:ferritin-like metal-binding protein YciE